MNVLGCPLTRDDWECVVHKLGKVNDFIASYDNSPAPFVIPEWKLTQTTPEEEKAEDPTTISLRFERDDKEGMRLLIRVVQYSIQKTITMHEDVPWL